MKAVKTAVREAGIPPLTGNLLSVQSYSDGAERPVFAGNGSGNAEESVLRLLAESVCGGRRTFFEDAETLRKRKGFPCKRLLHVGVENVEIV